MAGKMADSTICKKSSDRASGPRPQTHAKYREAIAACDSMEYVGCNVSQIASMFGLSGSGLSRQLRTHYPEVLESRERARLRLGIADSLPRGPRPMSRKQYARAVELLRSDRYITVEEAAECCGVSFSGLEQHLIFYHRELVENRTQRRKEASGNRCKGELTGRGSVHAPSPEIVARYAESLRLYSTTVMSARAIARMTGVSVKGFYQYLEKWHKDIVCRRKGVSLVDGTPVDMSGVRRYNPATAAKYAGAIARLKEGGLTMAAVAAEFGFNPEVFRQYVKEHEPDLHSSLGMRKNRSGTTVSVLSMEKYEEALRLYATTSESLISLATRFGFNSSSFGRFVRKNFPELHEQHRKLVARQTGR